jgi:hypothetical protein
MYVKHKRVFTLENLIRCPIHYLCECLPARLKVPKREIFDRTDFPDFYTIKSRRVGDFGVKIRKNLKNI